jgi:outer membrane usher protein FimD/PapC
VALTLGLVRPGAANAADEGLETAIVAVSLNEVPKGEYLIKAAAHDFLIRLNDLKAMGLADPRGEKSEIEGETYVSLKSMQGLTCHYDESRVQLHLTVDPRLLPKTGIDFERSRRADVFYPKDNSLFFNYGVAYQAGRDLTVDSFSATQQLGVRMGDALFLSDAVYTQTKAEKKWTRLMTNVTYDDRPSCRRIVLGDSYAVSGFLGSTVQLGGVSYSKNYDMDPYTVKQPGFDYSGYARLPSEVSVYLDGTRVRSEKVAPGGFDLNNILMSGGRHDLEIRVKDAFGREQIIQHPFYFSNTLLRKGMHEYSYNAGFLRKAYGLQSDRYGDPVFAASHRYGLTEGLTIGFQAEGMKGLLNGGSQMTYRLGKMGTLDGSLVGSAGDQDRQGAAGSLIHTYLGKTFNTRLSVVGYTKKYETLNDMGALEVAAEKTKYDIGAAIGYGNKALGSLSFDANYVATYGGEDRRAYGITYTRSLTKNLSLTASCRHVKQAGTDHQFFMGLTYYPGGNMTVSAGLQKDRGGQAASLQVQKNPPLGEGFSYRVSAEQKHRDHVDAMAVNPYIQYNGPFGVYAAEYRGTFDGDQEEMESWQASAAGSVVSVGGRWGFSRPIDDSFAIVEVGKTPGVLAYCNNQEIGRTDKTGKVVIPNLGAYDENFITINDQDIPVNYHLTQVKRYVSPPFRSGTLIRFNAFKIQALTGLLKIQVGDAEKPLEFYEMAIKVPGKDMTYPTGRGGEFYVENVPPGRYPVEFFYEHKPRRFMLTVPDSDEMIVDLGEMRVDLEDEKK